jgi:hypothetical protein
LLGSNHVYDRRRESSEEASGQTAMIVEDDQSRKLACGRERIWKHSSFYHIVAEGDNRASAIKHRRNSRYLERVRFELNHDRALSFCFDAFSSREPVPTSLENALAQEKSAADEAALL